MSDNCHDRDQKIMLISCSGASNLGRLSNQAAVELTMEGFGELFCLAGIGANLTGFVQSAKDAKEMIVIDGCDSACGKAILEKAGVPLKKHLIISQMGIRKTGDLNLNPDDLAKVKHAVKLAFKYPIKFSFTSAKPLSPGEQARAKLLGGRCC